MHVKVYTRIFCCILILLAGAILQVGPLLEIMLCFTAFYPLGMFVKVSSGILVPSSSQFSEMGS